MQCQHVNGLLQTNLDKLSQTPKHPNTQTPYLRMPNGRQPEAQQAEPTPKRPNTPTPQSLAATVASTALSASFGTFFKLLKCSHVMYLWRTPSRHSHPSLRKTSQMACARAEPIPMSHQQFTTEGRCKVC